MFIFVSSYYYDCENTKTKLLHEIRILNNEYNNVNNCYTIDMHLSMDKLNESIQDKVSKDVQECIEIRIDERTSVIFKKKVNMYIASISRDTCKVEFDESYKKYTYVKK
jgi:hypothetical protein